MIILGNGSYGEVVEDPKNSKYAIKTFNIEDTEDIEDKKIINNKIIFARELFYLSLVKDVPNFCQIVDYDINNFTITMEKYDSNLLDLLTNLPYSKRIRIIDDIIYQVYGAIKFLHSRGISHNDISPTNIFCNYDEDSDKIDCFLGDFSLTSINSNFKSHHRTKYLYYDVDDKASQIQSDIWAFGIVIFEFVSKIFKKKHIEFDKITKCIDYNILYPDLLISDYSNYYIKKFTMIKGSDRKTKKIIYDYSKIFNNLIYNNKDNVSKNAIKYLKFVAIDKLINTEKYREEFDKFFNMVDIITFVKNNFK